jgi:hypothetical protein
VLEGRFNEKVLILILRNKDGQEQCNSTFYSVLYLHARIVLAKDAYHVDDACCCKAAWYSRLVALLYSNRCKVLPGS